MSLHLRSFDRGNDYPAVKTWWEGHGASEVPLALLPAHGMVVELAGEPQAAGWLWMANCNGIALLVHMTTKPGLGAFAAYEALSHLVACLERQAAELNYGLVVAEVPARGGLRFFLGRMGFDEGNQMPHVHLTKLLKRPE